VARLILRSVLSVEEEEDFLALGAPTELALVRTNLSSMLDRWARFACPGGDSNATFNYAWAAATEYVVGEHVYEGNYLHVCTVAGTSGGSTPSWNHGTVRARNSNTGGSTTTDNTVTWQCVLDVGSAPYNGWNGTHRAYRTTYEAAFSLWYYDAVATIWFYRDYLSRTGLLTTPIEKKLEVYASYALSNFLQRNPFGTAPQGYFHFSDGLTQDYIRQSRVYKYAAQVTSANLLTQATTYALYGPDLGPQYYNGNYGWEEDLSREMTYYALNCVNYARAHSGTHLANITYGGVTENRMRWLIPYMLNHMRQWMNGVVVEPNGFGPFMFGLTAHTLREWYDLEVANGRDPNRYCISGQIGSLTNTSAISFTWTNIARALEEFCYWLRNTSTTSVGTGSLAMWHVANQAYRYRTVEGATDPGTSDLSGLIWPTFAWVANYCRVNGVTTGWTALQMMQHSDEMFNQMALDAFDSPAGAYIPLEDSTESGFCGKIFNETYKMPMISGFNSRNAATDRND
jgi:hypothetical protein